MDFRMYPFGNKRPYIWLFELKNNTKILNLNTYSKSDYKKDIEKLKSMPNSVIDWNMLLERVEKQSLFKTYGGYIWNLARWSANNYTDPIKPIGNIQVQWNKTLRDLGYVGAIDKGRGVIHENEPIQLAVFDFKAIEIIDKILNKSKIDFTDVIQIKNAKDVYENIELSDIFSSYFLFNKLSNNVIALKSNKKNIFLNKPFQYLLQNYITSYANEIENTILNNQYKNIENSNINTFVLIILCLLDLSEYPNITKFIKDNIKETSYIFQTNKLESNLDIYSIKLVPNIKLFNDNLKTLNINKNSANENELLNKYKTIIKSKDDFLKLSNAARQEIKNVFVSEFRFLNLLKTLQDENNDDVPF